MKLLRDIIIFPFAILGLILLSPLYLIIKYYYKNQNL